MHRLAAFVVLAALFTLGLACDDGEPRAPAPSSSGSAARGGGPIPLPRSDAGTPMAGRAGDTAGSAGAAAGSGAAGGGAGAAGMAGPAPALPRECDDIVPTMFVGGDPAVDVVASTIAPEDFAVSRVVATWEADCDKPTIRIELSDGSCPRGKGHVLTFWFEAAAIEDGAIGLGLNTILAEPDNLGARIRYVRPSRLKPSGEWGTCPGASAMFNIIGDPDTRAFSDLQVSRFDLELAPCDGSDNDKITVSGSFNVELQRGVAEVCPEK